MQSAKETAANMAASAKAGMEKTKATAKEQGEKMTTRDPLQKDIATQKKDERVHEAERHKLEAVDHNSATRQAAELRSHTTGRVPLQHPTGTGTGTGTGHTY